MKREYIIVAIIVIVLGVGAYLVMMNNKNTASSAKTSQIKSEEKVTIPTQDVKVTMPKAQNTNLDTTQLENEINNLDVEGNSDLDVDVQ